MKFAIIGSGNVGSAISRAVTDAGHEAVVAGPSEDGLRNSPTRCRSPRRPQTWRPSREPTWWFSRCRSPRSTASSPA